jgi:hypothetical protein
MFPEMKVVGTVEPHLCAEALIDGKFRYDVDCFDRGGADDIHLHTESLVALRASNAIAED